MSLAPGERRGPTAGRTLRWAVGIFALATLPYVNGITNGFTFDDVTIVAESSRIRTFDGTVHVFGTDWWDGRHPQSLLYRPMTMVSFAVDYAAARFGKADAPPARLPDRAARAFHVQSILWHGAASVSFFFLVLEMFVAPGLAIAAAALFAVHPVHTEAVDGIVGRAELMSACFVFLALFTAWRVMRDDPRRVAPAVLAGVLLLLALLSKEQAVVVPAIPLLWLAPLTREERSHMLGRVSFRWLLGSFVAALVVYLALRAAVLGSLLASGAVEKARIVVDNPVAGATGAARVLTPIRVFGEALRVLLFPRTLSADYSYAQLPLRDSPDGATIACGLTLLSFGAAVLLARRRAPALGFAIAFFLLTWALTSNIPIIIGTIFAERILYLPSAGICLAIAYLLTRAGSRPGARTVAAATVAVLALVGAARTWARNPDWQSNGTLFAAAAAASPRSCKALDGHAFELLLAGRPDDARPWAARALEIYPAYPRAHLTTAKILRALADREKAPAVKQELRAQSARHARTLIEMFASSPGDGSELADAWNVLGCLALDSADPDGALGDFKQSLAAKPTFVPSLLGSGSALALQAARASDAETRDRLRGNALAQFERAAAADPESAAGRGFDAPQLGRTQR
jgi:tetratricopeptide (TPR) repeat protein